MTKPSALEKGVHVRGTELQPGESRDTYRQKIARVTLDSMVQFVGLLDAEGTVLEINQVALDAVGIKLSDVEGKPFWTTFWWQVSESINQELREMIRRAAQGEFVRWDTEIYGRAGGKETIIIDASLMPVKDENGNVAFITAEGRDITQKKADEREIARQREELAQLDVLKTQFFADGQPFTAGELIARVGSHLQLAQLQKEAERTLQEANQRFRALVTSGSHVVYRMSPDWSELRELNGRGFMLDAQSPTTRWIDEYILPEDQPKVLEAIRRAVETKSMFELEHRVKRVDGTVGWSLSRAVPILDESGEIVEWFGAANDVTDRRNSAAASERLSAIVSSSDDAIVSKDLFGIVRSWNKAAEKIFGYTAEEMIGQSITKVIPPELHSDETRILNTIASGQRIDHFETVRVTKGGERIDVSLTVSPVKDASGQIVGAAKIARDITQQRRAERALHTAERLASVGRLAATVAHEINNPLEGLTNLVYLAKKAAARGGDVTKYLQAAEEELDRVSMLARQTLGFYRETSGPSTLRVGAMLNSLVTVFASRMRNKSIDLVLEVEGDPEIVAVPGEIRQVAANLIGNSIDAVENGGRIRIRVASSRDWRASGRTGVRLTVADNGTGISRENKAKLFEPFFTTKKDIGTGLGLWVCKSIVDKHRGAIRVKSRSGDKNSWTAFSIFLPSEAREDQSSVA